MQKLRTAAPEGIHRIAEIDFAGHIHLDAQVLAVGGVVSAYFSSRPEPSIPYWELGSPTSPSGCSAATPPFNFACDCSELKLGARDGMPPGVSPD